MRGLLDWLARAVEPYVSFRFVLALVFAGLAIHELVAIGLFLRDLARPRPKATERERQFGRVLKNFALLLVLKTFSRATLRENAGLIGQIVLLLVAAIGLNWWIYALPA